MRPRSLLVVAAFMAALVRTPDAVIATAANAPAPAGVWSIDPARSEVRFTVTKFGFDDVTGVFRESEGEVVYDAARPEVSRVQWRVRVASVLTDASSRDRSLLQPEYFDAAQHPYLQFVSQSVKRLEDGRLEVAGQITMRGVTRPLAFVARCIEGTPLRFETDFTVDRYDFGIAGGTVMGRLIGRTVRVHLVAGVRAKEGGQQ